MSEKPDWVCKLEAEPCECVRCGFCKGSGTIYFDLRGEFVGSGMTDDLDQPEPCDECSGGVEEECDRCIALSDYDRQLEDEREYVMEWKI